MLNKLGQWIYKNKFKALLIWLVIFIVFIASLVGLGSHYNSDLKISNLPSTNIQSTLEKEFHQNPSSGTMDVVIKNNHGGGVTTSRIKDEVRNSIRKTNQRDGSKIKSIKDPYQDQLISRDKKATYVGITFKKDSNAVSQHTIHSVEHAFNNVKQHAHVAYSGSVQITPLSVGEISEVIGMAIAFILLLILFRSFITAGLPIISAFTGLISGVALVGFGSHFLTINNFSQTLMSMLSLAVGIDYALFILNRYKTDLKSFKGNHQKALGNALSEAGKSVLFAGSTVIIAVCGLSLIKISFLTQMGFSAAIGVLFALFSALTLLPGLIAWAHNHIKANQKDVKTMAKHPNGFSRLLVDHPVISSLVALIILLCFAVPAGHMRLGMPYNGNLPKYRTERQAYDTLSNKFGEGVNSPLISVVKLNPNASKSTNDRNLQKVTKHLKNMSGVKEIVPTVNRKKSQQIERQAIQQAKAKAADPEIKQALVAKLTPGVKTKTVQELKAHPKLASDPIAQQKVGNQVKAKAIQQVKQTEKAKITKQVKAKVMAKAVSNAKKSKDGKYALVTIIPQKGSETVKTNSLAKHIKSYGKRVQDQYGSKITLTGISAINLDTVDKLNRAIPLFATIIIIVAFILLMIAFKSLLIPFIAMLGFGLSLLASFGLTTLVMQDGFMKGLFGISKGSPIIAFLPVIVIGILFGLAMDYEVFMVSRAREEYEKTHDNTRSILIAIQDSGPIVITAALIMIAVFGSFALNDNPTIKAMAIALAFGVFFDAYLVRLIIVPSMIKLFGKANWWFPLNHKKK